MKPGDLVRDITVNRVAAYATLTCGVGIILEKITHPRAVNNQVFKILWRNGTIGENVWDYDLELVNEKG